MVILGGEVAWVPGQQQALALLTLFVLVLHRLLP